MTGDRALLERMNTDIERLYKEGRDHQAHVLEERANTLARRMMRRRIQIVCCRCMGTRKPCDRCNSLGWVTVDA